MKVFKADDERDARMFEMVAAAVEEIAPGVELLRPGLIACSARGPARYFGSEQAAAERITDVVEALDVECRIGVADQLTVAVLAARHSTFVPIGQSAQFCHQLPVEELAHEVAIAPPERAGLVDLLKRLGITTMGEFAALPEMKVTTRFGIDGLTAYRLASGQAERGVSRRHIPRDLIVEQECDPPLERVDTAAFLARALADQFHQRLAAVGLACQRLEISATTEQGLSLSRIWRCTSPLTPAATADRLRWQLDGWLNSRSRPTSPDAIIRLRLEPIEAIQAGRIQYGLWGSTGEDAERAQWALARVQGLLGPESVVTPALVGGTSVLERIALQPWGQERAADQLPGPWPGQLPAPSPTRLVAAGPQSAVIIRDIHQQLLSIDDRGFLSASPAFLELSGRTHRITGWTRPWLYDQRWWQAQPGHPLARLQMLVADGPTLLLAYGRGVWQVEGVYD